MELICYLYPGWAPNIRPAPSRRDWMDATPQQFAYRCLPLNVANAHGWEILSPCDVEAWWNGRMAVEDVTVRPAPGTAAHDAPVSIFGQGVLTWHVQGLFRTPPGWNLWVGGSPNRFKHAIQPLTGIVETDWAPFTFTMNWRFTKPWRTVRFEKGEPICFVFPVQRGAVENFEPKFVSMDEAPELKAQFELWSRDRNAFQAQVRQLQPEAGAERWQKHYYRGVDMEGQAGVADHRTKLRLKPFRPAGAAEPEPPADEDVQE